MANRSATLAEIRNAMEAGEVETFAPMRVYVVNHFAEVRWPRKYVYQACPRRMASYGQFGRTCGRKLEGSMCPNHPNQEIGVDTYRFDLFLSDGAAGGRPLQVTIFDAVEALTGVTAERFKKLAPMSQFEKVTYSIQCMPEVEATLRVHDQRTYVQSMILIGGQAPISYDSPRRGPTSVVRDYNLTPNRLSLFAESSSQELAGTSNEAVKEKVAELVDLIAESLSL